MICCYWNSLIVISWNVKLLSKGYISAIISLLSMLIIKIILHIITSRLFHCKVPSFLPVLPESLSFSSLLSHPSSHYLQTTRTELIHHRLFPFATGFCCDLRCETSTPRTPNPTHGLLVHAKLQTFSFC